MGWGSASVRVDVSDVSDVWDGLRVAIVSDQLATPGGAGGAERVVLKLHELFPAAPVFTTVFNPDRMGGSFSGVDVRPSWVDRLPLARKHHGLFFPIMPMAVESFDLTGYDLVISSQHSVAHGALTRPDAVHISYCHSPMRYAWDLSHSYLRTIPKPARAGVSFALSGIRIWDSAASLRVDHFVANSEYVAGRIQRAYRRAADVIPPPVRLRFAPPDPGLGRFLLVVSRLVPYKRIDLAIAACNRLNVPLVVIGAGPELKRLQALAGPTIRFLGRQPDATVLRYMASCEALLFPGCEDFGMTPVEVMAAGRPVIAFGQGGAKETVIHGETGWFFERQEVDDVACAILQLRSMAWNPAACQRQAAQFGEDRFEERFLAFILARVALPAEAGDRRRPGGEPRRTPIPLGPRELASLSEGAHLMPVAEV